SAALTELARLATDLGPALKPLGHEDLMTAITGAAKRVLRAQACSVAILDEEGENLVFYAASSDAGTVVGQRVPVGRGIAGWVIASGQPVAISDLSNDPRFSRDVAERTGYVPRSI